MTRTVLYLYGQPVEIVDAHLHLSLVGNRWFGVMEIRARYVGEREDEDTFVIAAFSADERDQSDAMKGDVGGYVSEKLAAQATVWRQEQVRQSAMESMQP